MHKTLRSCEWASKQAEMMSLTWTLSPEIKDLLHFFWKVIDGHLRYKQLKLWFISSESCLSFKRSPYVLADGRMLLSVEICKPAWARQVLGRRAGAMWPVGRCGTGAKPVMYWGDWDQKWEEASEVLRTLPPLTPGSTVSIHISIWDNLTYGACVQDTWGFEVIKHILFQVFFIKRDNFICNARVVHALRVHCFVMDFQQRILKSTWNSIYNPLNFGNWIYFRFIFYSS